MAAWLLEGRIIVCQEKVVQPSHDVEGRVCADEEQAGLGHGFVGLT